VKREIKEKEKKKEKKKKEGEGRDEKRKKRILIEPYVGGAILPYAPCLGEE
jgi:hypothetical protein